jgi:hypothetical protein
MAEAEPNLLQQLGLLLNQLEEWVEERFGDPELAAEIKDDLGLDPTNPATPTPTDPARKARLEAFAKKTDVDEAALAAVVVDIKATADTLVGFYDAIKAEGMDPWTLFWTIFRLFAVDMLRVRNPSAFALVRLLGMVTDHEEALAQLDPSRLGTLVRGEATEADGEALIQRLSMAGGLAVVIAATAVEQVDAVIDATYGWDPDPGEEGDAAVVASRALTAIVDKDVLGGVRPALTLIGVPSAHGGPGLFVSATAAFELSSDIGETTYTTQVTGAGRFGAFLPILSPAPVRLFGGASPGIRISAQPRAGRPPGAPALVVGTTDATRLEIGALAYGVEIADELAAFRLSVRKGKLVVALGKGDSFLRQLPGGNVEVPFELGLVADTANGLRLEGGTGIKVTLPVSASLFGIFTVQFLELELLLEPTTAVELRAAFSLQLGPFAASIDRAGLRLDVATLSRGFDALGELVAFAPPKGIGLVLDAGVVKGGGYLFVDAQRGEYAGALELKFLTFSIKAIGVLATKRPDGSEGWSLLLFVFGQFSVPLGNTGIFWTGLGGMIGLHHRADVDALSAGMRTGALDDILFPENPVADAPRIINRYRTLFPVQQDNLLIGPMLELSFSQPPIVQARIGLVFDVRNALGGNAPTALSKVILIGQLLVQLPPKALGAPAVLKLLVDVVGFYDADTAFLLIRARLRDSFVGIEGVTTLKLAGELLIAVQFGKEPNLVLSAGGFHPRYDGLPDRVPRDLDRLRVSFKIKPVELSVEQYFAVTPNSVQAGQKAVVKADFGVASIDASLSWDALLYLSPRFSFIVDLDFKAKVKAFGRTLASVGVTATLEGPDEWRIQGTFSFSILWWDKTVPFDESWGEQQVVDAGTASLAQALLPELSNPDNLEPQAPIGASLVALAPAGGSEKLAHPLGRLAVRQRAVPFALHIDRIGTQRLEGGPTSVSVTSAALNDAPLIGFESATESFARGQFAELTDEERLGGKVFEPFPCGVVVGRTEYATPDDRLAHDVTASFETVRLVPRTDGLTSKWSHVRLAAQTPGFASLAAAAKLGAAARSEGAHERRRNASPLGLSAVAVGEPPMALVARDDLVRTATLLGVAAASPSLAAQEAAAGGHRVVEDYEVTA